MRRQSRNRSQVRSALIRRAVESLESRTLLASFYPLTTAADGALNSLRAAVIASNGNNQNDTINLKSGRYELTIPNVGGLQENAAATGDLDLTDDGFTVTFKGAGQNKTFIDANQIDRVFQVFPSVTVVFKDLTITGGLAQD